MSFTYTIISAVWFHGPVTPRGLWRNDTIVQLYHILLVFNSYFRERSDRQSFMLRSELKTQYRAVQSAQDQERRAEESKKRFVSYSE
jgi:hypothetical protein